MRIAFAVNGYPLLSETFVADQVAGLVRRGHEVVVHAYHRHGSGNGAAAHHPPEALGVPAVGWWDRRWIVRRTLRETAYPGQGALLAAAERRFHPGLDGFDAVIAHFGWNGLRIAHSKEAGWLRTPLATFFHGYDVARAARAGTLGRYAPLFRRGEANLAVSDRFRGVLVGAGADPARTSTFRMGVDVDAIPFRHRDRGDGPLRIVTVGRLVEKKGTEYALRALAALDAARPDIRWSLDVAGDGDLRPRLVRLAADLGVADRVRFRGALPHPEVKALLTASDLFLLPSVTASDGDSEGVPVVLMEAMAAGLPVISSLHSGIPELVDDGRTGFLAPERDHGALARRIERAADDPEGCRSVAAEARRKVETDFSSDRLLDDLENLLLRVAAGRRR